MLDPAVWGTVSDWVVAVTTVVAAIAAVVQLRRSAHAQHEQVQLARANLLREIDLDFESATMQSARQKFLVMRNRFESEAASLRPALNDEAQITKVAELFSNYVSDLWEKSRTFDGDPDADKDASAEEYALLMRLPLWCETVGHLCQRNLIPSLDVLDLYDQAIINTIGNIRGHITLRAERPPHKNRRYLENAVWLYQESVRHKRSRDTPAVTSPEKAKIR